MTVATYQLRRGPQILGFFCMLAVTYVAAKALGMTAIDWRSGTADFSEYASRYSSIEVPLVPSYVGQMAITIAMGVVGTALALGCGILLAPLASKLIGYPPVVTWTTRSIFSFLRATPDPVFAILLLMWIGVGPHGGALALFLHSLGFVGKSLVDTVDRMPHEAWKGVSAAGASRLQIYLYAAIPCILPELESLSLYTLDRNVRTATVLGIIGSGGIGLVLKTSMDTFHYREATTALAVIAVFVLCLEVISDRLRRKISSS